MSICINIDIKTEFFLLEFNMNKYAYVKSKGLPNFKKVFLHYLFYK